MRSLATVAAANLGRPMPPRLSIDGNRFTLIDSAGNERPHNLLTLDIVIIDLNDHTSKMYWGKEYNPNDTGDIPICWSDNGEAPSVQAQSPQSLKCMTCPHNAIGSAISKFTGAKIKACVDMKKVAFIVPGEQGIYLMTIKPGSFKNWSAYVNMLAGQKSNTHPGGVELYEVITQLAFESQGVLKFSPVGWSKLDEAQAAFDRGVTPEIVGANDQPWQGQLAGPQPGTTALPPPVQQAAQQNFMQPAPVAAGQQAPLGAQPTPVTASPSDGKRKRRTKAEIEADNARVAQATVMPPAGTQFMQSSPTVTAPFPNPQPAPNPVLAPPAQGVPAAQPPTGQAAVPNADGLDIPSFLRREQPAQQAAQPSPAQFGLAQPAAPDKSMQAAIDAAFALPTG
jgi:hypothetical protein